MMHGYQYLYLDHDDKGGKKKKKDQANAYRENNPEFFNCTRMSPDFTKFYTICERYGKKMRANWTHFIKISLCIHLHATMC